MSKFTTLHVSGLKGVTAEVPLTGLDLLCGPNGAGKSAHLQAVQFALLGYIPGVNQRLESIMAYASGDKLSAGLSTPDFRFVRTIKRSQRKGKVTFSQDLLITPAGPEKTDADKEAVIAKHCGTFPAAVDLSTFTSQVASARRKFIVNLIGGQLTWDQVADFLTGKEVDPAVILDLAGLWKDSDIEGSLVAMKDWADGRATAANQHHRDAEGACEILRQKLADSGEGLKVRIASEEQRHKDMIERRVSLEKQLSTLQTAEKQRMERAAAIADTRNEIKLLEGELEASGGVDFQKLHADSLRTKLATPLLPPPDRTVEITAARAAVDAAQETVDLLQGLHDEAYGAKTRIDALLGKIGTGLPLCVLSTADQRIGCPKDWTPEQARLTAAAEEAETQRSGVSGMLQDAKYTLVEAKAKLTAVENKAAGEARMREEAAKAREPMAKELAELERQIAARADKRAAKQAALADKKQMLAALEGVTPATVDGDIPQLTADLAAIKTAIAQCEAGLTELRGKATAAASLAAAEQTQAQAKEALDAARALASAVGPSGLGGLALKTGVGAMEQDVTDVLAQIGLPQRASFWMTSEQGREVFDFGWSLGGTTVPFETMSTGERLLYTLAIATAFLQRSRPPVRVLLLDNIETLDRDNRDRLMGACHKLVEGGILDNVLAAGVVDEWEDAGWNVINLPGRAS